MPRKLVSDDGATRLYRVTDSKGKVLGEDRESVPGPEETVALSLRERTDQDIDAMQAHIDRGTFTARQGDAALLLVLSVNVALARLALGRLERE